MGWREARAAAWASPPARQTAGTYIVHGVQQLGELEEALPGLAGVVGGFSHRTPELLDVIQPHLLERCLVLQTLFGNWGKKKNKSPVRLPGSVSLHPFNAAM